MAEAAAREEEKSHYYQGSTCLTRLGSINCLDKQEKKKRSSNYPFIRREFAFAEGNDIDVNSYLCCKEPTRTRELERERERKISSIMYYTQLNTQTSSQSSH